jgi:hypothetical protein
LLIGAMVAVGVTKFMMLIKNYVSRIPKPLGGVNHPIVHDSPSMGAPGL